MPARALPLARPSLPTPLAAALPIITLTLALVFAAAPARADTSPLITVDAQGFQPKELALPPGKKVKLTIHNKGPLPAEFESYDLSREVIVPPGSRVSVYVGPLEAGRYKFFNDFNQSQTGAVVVKPTEADAQGGQ